jgi:hypothetical protein
VNRLFKALQMSRAMWPGVFFKPQAAGVGDGHDGVFL